MACSDAASRPLGADAVEVYPRDPTVNSGWRRYELAFRAKTRYANPFEVEFGATFQHAGSGESLTLPGYYAGDDTWKVSFMPTRNGRWDWTTSSPETRLNSRRGSIEHAAKGRMARLGADPRHPRKWRLGEDPVIPVAIRCDFFSEPASGETFVQEADFVARNGILLMETRLTEEYGQFGNRYDFVFEGSWRDHRFDLEIWDRMQRRMDILAARGCGAHIMLYSDDRGAPGWSGRSETERLVIRYVIARLAAYPVVLFNTGIDIAEYRSQIDIDWMNEEFRQLDPYHHPISSRRGGGSGQIRMHNRSFESWGDTLAKYEVIAKRFRDARVPVSMDDAWFENGPKKYANRNHTPEEIRRGLWKCVVAGGAGTLIRGAGDGGHPYLFHLGHIEADLESEQWVRLVNPFIRGKLGKTFFAMVPDNGLATNAWALADPEHTKILVVHAGPRDRIDPSQPDAITLHLGDLDGRFAATWFDPRTGRTTPLPAVRAGADVAVSAPSKDDWVLLLVRQ